MSVNNVFDETTFFSPRITALPQFRESPQEDHFDGQNIIFRDSHESLERASTFIKFLVNNLNAPKGSKSPLQVFLERSLHLPATEENKSLLSEITQVFFKQKGYFYRLFSNESWEEWFENRTTLGKVASQFSNCIESRAEVCSFTKVMNPQLIQKANEETNVLQYHMQEDFVNLGLTRQSQIDTSEEHHSRVGKGDEEGQFGKVVASQNSPKLTEGGIKGLDAREVMRISKSSCLCGLTSGIAASFLLENPLPLLLGLSECFPRASAQQKVGNEFQVNTYTNNQQWLPSVASFSNGNFVVTWTSDGQDGDLWGVYGQLFDGNYTKIGIEFQVNTYTTSIQARPSVASFSNGNFVVTWYSDQDGSGNGVYGQLFDGNGSTIGSEFRANTYTTNSQADPSVASLADGNFVVTWNSDGQDGDRYGVYGQLFDGNGSKIGSEFQANTYVTFDQWFPSVASFSNGNFVVTWSSRDQDGSNLGVYGQVFDGNGSTIGSEFRANSYTTNDQGGPSVTSFSNGNFVVTWSSRDQDGSNLGVYGQVFDGNGSNIGSEFQANTYVTFDQWFPSVASFSNGNFVVAWESDGQDGSGYGVYGQLFDGNGSTIGSEFQVNTFTANNQANPSVTDLSNNNFIVTWQSDLQDTASYGIYGQIFFDNISTSTSSTTTSSSTTSTTTSTSSTTTTSSVTTIKSSSTISTPLSSSSEISNELTSISPSSNRGFRWLWLILGGTGGATCLNLLGYYLFKKRPWQQKEVSSPSDQRELQAIEDPLRAVSKHDSRRDSEYSKLSDIQGEPTEGDYANRPKGRADSEYANRPEREKPGPEYANRPKRADLDDQYANPVDTESDE